MLRQARHALTALQHLLQDAACEAWSKVWSALEKESPDMALVMMGASIVSVSVSRATYAALRKDFPGATSLDPMRCGCDC